jgi:4'-phosphopantetheinyl transferase
MAAVPLSLPAGEVHWWCINLDVPSQTVSEHHAVLTEDERQRCTRLRFARDRQRFIVARGVLRQLLGCYLETEPGHLRFTYNPAGKPALSPEFGCRLRFNLSHSAGLALIALARDAEVGIDLEQVRAQPEYALVARDVFAAAEVSHLNGLPSRLRSRGFLKCWTRKEAYVKARGDGLAADDSTSDVPPPGAWSLFDLRPAPGFVGAVAVEGRGWRLRQRHWGSGAPMAVI